MRVIHLNADRGIGPKRSKGAAVHLRAMREAFAELGAEVVAIDEANAEKVSSLLEETLRQGPVELVYERLSLNAFAGGEFARRHGLPHVLEVNAPLDEEAARYRADASPEVDADRMGELVRGARLVLCVSNECAEWARRKGAQDDRVVVAGNGVDTARFHPSRRDELPSSVDIPTDAFVIGFHGRLRPWHGFERLVAATKDLVERGLPVHLLMIGKGEYAEAVRGVLPRDRWTHVPWVDHDDVGSYVARYDVLPLSYDPSLPCYFSPLKLLEGMAAGAVAVVPDLGDLASTVQDGRAGLIYDPNDDGALAQAIAQLHADPDSRAALVAEGRRVAKEHSWISIAELVLNYVEEGVR